VHPRVFETFDGLCARREAGGAILEVGAVPSRDSLLCLPALRRATSKVGINLDGPASFGDFEILQRDANDMRCFADGSFDTVLCNATLEHDRHFWKTLDEIRRVARPGALVAIGVPGFASRAGSAPRARSLLRRALRRAVRRLPAALSAWAPALAWHPYPSDYFRFSPDAMRDVICAGLAEVEIEQVLWPPRIIGGGVKV
jgi:SAM-dependent methyltransferase